jgi:hypothetical protein
VAAGVSGFILLHRGWRENPIFRGEFSRADAWVWMIENACWKPTRTRIKGDNVELQRGELTFAQRFLAEKWGWSKSRVDRFIADLRDQGMIKTRSKNGATDGHSAGQGQCIITICNYAKYQDKSDVIRGNNDGDEWGNSGATAGQQRGKEEQGNKGTIEEEPNGSSPPIPPKAKKRAPSSKFAMPADWEPGPLPADVAELVAQWPPGRFDREVADVRAYWIEDGTKRPGWDRTLHSRIRTIHDRVMRESRNGNHQPPRDNRDGFARALDRELGLDDPAGQAGRRDAGDGGGAGKGSAGTAPALL